MKSAFKWFCFTAPLVLAACSGIGTAPQPSNVIPQTQSVVLQPQVLPANQTVGGGQIFGTDNTFTPNDGDTSTGGHGSPVDSIPCNRLTPIYHVHFFIGLIVNGQHLAWPDGMGMDRPTSDFTLEPQGIPNWTQSSGCYYYLHAHDASGVVHVESPANQPKTASLFTVGNAFDIWGMPLSSTNVVNHAGTVTAYVAQPPLKTHTVSHTTLVRFTGNPRSIPIHSHTVVWLEVGSPSIATSGLSNITFYEEY
jgi:hypothetical protein